MRNPDDRKADMKTDLIFLPLVPTGCNPNLKLTGWNAAGYKKIRHFSIKLFESLPKSVLMA